MQPLYNTKLGPFREIIISRATSGGRREIELNSGSLPPIPGGLATLVTGETWEIRETWETGETGETGVTRETGKLGKLG